MTTRIIGGTGIEFPDATQQITRGVPNDGPVFRAKQNIAQSIPATTYTPLVYSPDFDPDGIWQDGTTLRTDVPGYYFISATAFTVNGDAHISIFLNGVEYKRGSQHGGGAGFQVSGVVPLLLPGDEVTVQIRTPAATTTYAGLSVVDGYLVRAL